MDTMVVRGCGWRRTAWRGVEIGDDDDGAMVVLGFCQARARGCGAIGGASRARGGAARWCAVVLVSRRAGVASASPMRGRDGDARGMTAQ